MKDRPSKGNRKKKWKLVLTAAAAAVVCGGLLLAGLQAYGKYQMGKVPRLSFRETLEYTTRDNAEAVITVGVIRDGSASYTVYGENGTELLTHTSGYEGYYMESPMVSNFLTGKNSFLGVQKLWCSIRLVT